MVIFLDLIKTLLLVNWTWLRKTCNFQLSVQKLSPFKISNFFLPTEANELEQQTTSSGIPVNKTDHSKYRKFNSK